MHYFCRYQDWKIAIIIIIKKIYIYYYHFRLVIKSKIRPLDYRQSDSWCQFSKSNSFFQHINDEGYAYCDASVFFLSFIWVVRMCLRVQGSTGHSHTHIFQQPWVSHCVITPSHSQTSLLCFSPAVSPVPAAALTSTRFVFLKTEIKVSGKWLKLLHWLQSTPRCMNCLVGELNTNFMYN